METFRYNLILFVILLLLLFKQWIYINLAGFLLYKVQHLLSLDQHLLSYPSISGNALQQVKALQHAIKNILSKLTSIAVAPCSQLCSKCHGHLAESENALAFISRDGIPTMLLFGVMHCETFCNGNRKVSFTRKQSPGIHQEIYCIYSACSAFSL